MSIQSEINTASVAIDDIKTEIRNHGVSVLATDTVVSLKTKIDQIENTAYPFSNNVLTDIIEGTIQYLYDTELLYIRPYCFAGCNLFKLGWFTKLKKLCPHSFDGCRIFDTLILDVPERSETDNLVVLESVNAFKNTPIGNLNGNIYVKDNLVTKYKTAENWNYYASIIKPLSNRT